MASSKDFGDGISPLPIVTVQFGTECVPFLQLYVVKKIKLQESSNCLILLALKGISYNKERT
jgi:hypothetical protein